MKFKVLLLVCAVGYCTSQITTQDARSAVVEFKGLGPSGAQISGQLQLEQNNRNSPVKIRGVVYGLPAGPHGIHVHENGDCQNPGQHFNPLNKRHGGPNDPERHAGDLGNIRSMPANPNRASFSLVNDGISLFEDSQLSIVNRVIIIHTEKDDLGRGANRESLITGNSGGHLACGFIASSKGSQIRGGASSWSPTNPIGAEESSYQYPKRSTVGLESDWMTDTAERSFPRSKEYPSGRKGMEVGGKIASNLNVEGVEQPDYTEHVFPIKSTPMSTSRVWKVGNVYEYEYIGWIATGMPSISPQLSGGSIKGRIVVEPKDESTVVLALTNTRSNVFNEDVMERWDQANPGQEVPLIDKEHVEKPIVVKIINGKVESVGISSDDPLWVVNFKRALAAQLTLQLDESSAIFSDVESKEFYNTNAVYSIVEDCPTGECQTYYHLSRVPEEEVETNRDILPLPEICSAEVYEIVKNRDFDKCKVLPVFNYFNTRGLECNLAELGSCKNMLSRVDIVRIIGCVAKDGSFVVQNIKDTDKVIEKPFGYETEPLEGSSIQRWTLRSVHSAAGASVLAGRLPSNLQVHKTLVYAYDEELSVQGPYLQKPSLHQHELPLVQEPSKDAVKSELVRLFSEVVQTLESDEYYADPVGKYVPAKINMIKVAMMYLNYQELAALASNLLGPKSSTANQVFVDALVACGTNPAVMLLKDLITQGQLTKEQAIQAVATLPATVKTPTKELLSSLVQFFRSDVVSSHRRLKITTALSLSLLVDKACVNTTDGFKLFPEMVMGQFCTPESNVVVNEVIPLLTEELNNADDEAEKIALLAALGNIGHEAIIPAVFPYISSCDPSTEEEFKWTERQRRSAKEGSKMDKKSLRKMWILAKRGNSKAKKELEKQLEKESEEEEFGAKSPKARKQLAKEMKERHKLEAEEREQEMQIRAWELQQKRKQDLERMQEKSLKKKAKLGKKAKKGKTSFWGAEEEEEEEEDEEELSGFLGDQPWSSSFKTLGLGKEEEEEEEEGVQDEALCNIVRMKAVYALSKLATEKNEAVLPVLMPITFNKEEETEVRLAALSLLFVHNLPAGFWTRVAISTWFEPNDHISTFIYTTIASLAKNKDPKKRDLATKAEAVIPLVKPIRWAPHISTGSINGQFQERTRLGYLANTFTFGGLESFMPANMYHSIFVRMGPWTTKILELSVNGKQLEKFIDQWIGEPTRRWQTSGVYGGVKGQTIASPELSQIHQELKIEARAQGKPELFIFLNFVDNYQRFYHVDESSFEDLLTNVVRHQALRGSGGKVTTNYHKYYPAFSKMIRIPSAMGLAYGLVSQHKTFSNIRSSLTGSMNLGGTTNAEGILQPVAGLKFLSKMNVELPFAKAVAASGVDIALRAALPGKFAVSGDYVNGKLEATWKFLGDKVRAAHYNVIPFITIRHINDFTPLLLLKETKPISLLDKLKESSNIYGARPTGLNWVYVERHDAKALNTPLSFTKDTAGTIAFLAAPSTLRYCEHSLFLDVGKSETKAIKLQLSIDSKHQKQMTKSTMSRNIMSEGMFAGPYGKKLRAGKFMEEDVEDEWQQHKFSKLFKSLTSAYGFSIDSSVEFVSGGATAGAELPMGMTKGRRYGVSVTAGFDPMEQIHKSHFTMEKFHEEDPEANFMLCLEGNINWPKVFAAKRENFLKDEINTLGLLNVNFGKSCTSDRQISIKAEFTYSDEKEQQYTKYKEARLNELQCIADELKGHGMSEECINTQRLATVLNKGIITIKYNEMPAAVRNMTHKAENVLRHWLGAYLSDNQVGVRNENNQVRIETVYHPVLGTLDIRTFKPESNTFFHNIEVTPIAEAVVPFHPATTAYRSAFGGPGICVVDEDAVTTYDRVTYKASLSGCDTVITKDCSGRYKMAVLAREEGNNRIVTVLLNKEKIELNPALGRVRINGVEKAVSSAAEGIHQVLDDLNQVIATVRQTRDNLLEVASPTHWIRVTVGPKFIAVMGSAIHRGRLCGMCGTQSGDKTDDLTGPRKCALPANLMDVAYELNRPAGCKSSSRLSKEVEDLRQIQQSCKAAEESAVRGSPVGYKSLFGNPFTSEFGMSKSFMGSSCSAIRNKKMFQAGAQCYSVTPVAKCVQGCKPVSVMEKKVGFHCVAKNALAEHLERERVRRPLDELVNKEIHTVETVEVPTACVPEY